MFSVLHFSWFAFMMNHVVINLTFKSIYLFINVWFYLINQTHWFTLNKGLGKIQKMSQVVKYLALYKRDLGRIYERLKD